MHINKSVEALIELNYERYECYPMKCNRTFMLNCDKAKVYVVT